MPATPLTRGNHSRCSPMVAPSPRLPTNSTTAPWFPRTRAPLTLPSTLSTARQVSQFVRALPCLPLISDLRLRRLYGYRACRPTEVQHVAPCPVELCVVTSPYCPRSVPRSRSRRVARPPCLPWGPLMYSPMSSARCASIPLRITSRGRSRRGGQVLPEGH